MGVVSIGLIERTEPYADGLVVGRYRTRRAARRAVAATFTPATEAHGPVAVDQHRYAAWHPSGVVPGSREHHRLAAHAARRLERA